MAILKARTVTLADGQSLTGAWTSDVFDASGGATISIAYFIPAGTHAGTLTLKSGQQSDPTVMSAIRFINNVLGSVTTGIVTLTNGPVFNGGICITQATERYYCLVWAPSGGTGTINAYACVKNGIL